MIASLSKCVLGLFVWLFILGCNQEYKGPVGIYSIDKNYCLEQGLLPTSFELSIPESAEVWRPNQFSSYNDVYLAADFGVDSLSEKEYISISECPILFDSSKFCITMANIFLENQVQEIQTERKNLKYTTPYISSFRCQFVPSIDYSFTGENEEEFLGRIFLVRPNSNADNGIAIRLEATKESQIKSPLDLGSKGLSGYVCNSIFFK